MTNMVMKFLNAPIAGRKRALIKDGTARRMRTGATTTVHPKHPTGSLVCKANSTGIILTGFFRMPLARGCRRVEPDMDTPEWIAKGVFALLTAVIIFILGSHERRIRSNDKDITDLGKKHEKCSAEVQARLTAGDEDFKRFEAQNQKMEENINAFNTAIGKQEVLLKAADRQIQKMDERLYSYNRNITRITGETPR